MSFICALPAKVPLKEGVISEIFNKNSCSTFGIPTEIGISFVTNNETLERYVGFKDLAELETLIKDKEEHLNNGVIVYIDRPFDKFKFGGFSPILVNSDFALASCGDVLDFRCRPINSIKSNTQIFVEDKVAPLERIAPGCLGESSVQWMIRRFLKKYASVAILHRSGKLYLLNKDLYKMEDGIYFMDYDKAKTKHNASVTASYSTANNGVVYSAGKKKVTKATTTSGDGKKVEPHYSYRENGRTIDLY